MYKINRLIFGDYHKYEYLMNAKEIKNYIQNASLYAFVGLVLFGIIGYYVVSLKITFMAFCIVGIGLGFRIPYILLRMRYKQKNNEIVDAIPIWVNMIYSLIGENNIFNAISITEKDCPLPLKEPLKEFIKKIESNNDDKDAYMDFLKVYDIEGFKDIMMKLYEFRNLSKDKLKYEISSLNDILGKLEEMKRINKQKSELFLVDNSTMILIMVPCMYLFFVSLLLSEVMM